MDRQRKIAALVRALGNPASAGSMKSELAFVCPQAGCRKDRKKLAVNVVTDFFHCWICGFAGRSLVPLLRHGRQEDLEEYYGSREKKTDKDPAKFDRVVLPEEFEPLWKSGIGPFRDAADSYMRSRGATLDDIVRMRIGHCESGRLVGRIVFPSYGADGLDFVIARSYRDCTPKYLNGGNYEKDIVFNGSLLDWTSPVVLVEGPFDSLIAGWNSIPLLGKTILPNLKRQIVKSGVDVFVALDIDAKRDGMSLIGDLLSYGITCKFVPMGKKKDVGSMTREEFEDAKARASQVDSDVSLIRASLEALF